MAEIRPKITQKWRNYHWTRHREQPDHRDLIAVAQSGETPQSFFKRTGDALRGLMWEAVKSETAVIPMGAAWSFSDVLCGPGIVLETKRSEAMFLLDPTDVLASTDRSFALVSGGTKIEHLNKWLERRGYSLRTTGAHNGQTVAGMCGTGTHGSVLDFGAFQNHVLGMHLIAGPNETVWVERGPGPLLNEEFVAGFAERVERGEDLLAACQVHLGGLGIVNAVLIEVVPEFGVAVVRRKAPMTASWLSLLEHGEFKRFAKEIWPDAPPDYGEATPYYAELILNPFTETSPVSPRPRPAIVTLLYKTESPNRLAPEEPLVDVLDLLEPEPDENLVAMPWVIAEGVTRLMKEEPATGDAPRVLTWDEANGPHNPLIKVIFNAAYAFRRQDLTRALGVIKEAFLASGPEAAGPVVFTLRFVKAAEGLLAFTAFPETVVVNMDGLRSGASTRSAEQVALALEMAGIDFRQHWAKQGEITRSRFAAGYEKPGPTDLSPAQRWRLARGTILERGSEPLFGNDSLRLWELI